MSTKIIDFMPLKVDNVLNESKSGQMIISGTIQRADAKNKNQRIYPKSILESAVGKYIQKKVNTNSALGELDHPVQTSVSLKNACINIKKIWWEGNDVKANIQVLNTPAGKTLQALINDGVTVGISSRGTGSTKMIKEDSGQYHIEVQSDYGVECWDIVSDPSTHNATVGLTESTDKHNEINKVDTVLNEMINNL